MKYLSRAIVILVMLFASILPSCAGGSGAGDASSQISADEIKNVDFSEAEAAVLSCGIDVESLSRVDSMYIEYVMQLSVGEAEILVMLESSGGSLDEFGIVRSDEPSAVKKALEDYLARRRSEWTGLYLVDEYPKLRDAEVKVIGEYVIYGILSQEDKTSLFSSVENLYK